MEFRGQKEVLTHDNVSESPMMVRLRRGRVIATVMFFHVSALLLSRVFV